MGMPWRQTRLYDCPSCGSVYLHDRAYAHSLFSCPSRTDRMKTQHPAVAHAGESRRHRSRSREELAAATMAQWLASGRVYRPAVERDR